MARKRHRPEEIAAKLRPVEVLESQGMTGIRSTRVDCEANSANRRLIV